MRPRAIMLAAVLATGLMSHAAPTAQAAQKGKARSNLASGDIRLLEQAFGSKARLQGNKRGARPPALGRAQQEAVRRLKDAHDRAEKNLAKRTQEADKRLKKRLSGGGKGTASKAKATDNY